MKMSSTLKASVAIGSLLLTTACESWKPVESSSSFDIACQYRMVTAPEILGGSELITYAESVRNDMIAYSRGNMTLKVSPDKLTIIENIDDGNTYNIRGVERLC